MQGMKTAVGAKKSNVIRSMIVGRVRCAVVGLDADRSRAFSKLPCARLALRSQSQSVQGEYRTRRSPDLASTLIPDH